MVSKLKYRNQPMLPYYMFASINANNRSPMVVDTGEANIIPCLAERRDTALSPIIRADIVSWKRWIDMPFTLNNEIVVSERLLSILVELQRDAVLSSPLCFVRHVAGSVSDAPKYFVVDTNLIVDCADLSRSVPELEPTWKRFKYFYLDPSRVPPASHFFRPAGMGYAVVSHHVRLRAEAMGATGLDFTSPDMGVLKW